jgi:hypothetical protein
MKLSPISGDMAVKLAIGAGAVLAVYLITKKAGEKFDSMGQGFADAVDAVIAAPGKAYEATKTAGQAMEEYFTPDYVKENGGIWQTNVNAVGAVVDFVNPNSTSNGINRGLTSAGATLSGDKNWTFGGWIYDLTH